MNYGEGKKIAKIIYYQLALKYGLIALYCKLRYKMFWQIEALKYKTYWDIIVEQLISSFS